MRSVTATVTCITLDATRTLPSLTLCQARDSTAIFALRFDCACLHVSSSYSLAFPSPPFCGCRSSSPARSNSLGLAKYAQPGLRVLLRDPEHVYRVAVSAVDQLTTPQRCVARPARYDSATCVPTAESLLQVLISARLKLGLLMSVMCCGGSESFEATSTCLMSCFSASRALSGPCAARASQWLRMEYYTRVVYDR